MLDSVNETLTGRIEFDPVTGLRRNFSATVVELHQSANHANSILEVMRTRLMPFIEWSRSLSNGSTLLGHNWVSLRIGLMWDYRLIAVSEVYGIDRHWRQFRRRDSCDPNDTSTRWLRYWWVIVNWSEITVYLSGETIRNAEEGNGEQNSRREWSIRRILYRSIE